MTPNLTAAGRNILLRALAGDPIKFTKVKLGNGASQNPDSAKDLNNALMTLSVSSITIGTNYVTLVTTFSNSSITSGFHITEAGFYVEDPDNPSNEVLYALGNEPESSSDYIPAASNRIVEMQYNALIFIGDAENVSAAISSSLVYVIQEDFDDHLKDYNNPHQVTKAQVGLGNVPNVSTNNQMPTFTEATNLTVLTSGDRMSILFGKLKKAVSSLISHLGARNNPHNRVSSLEDTVVGITQLAVTKNDMNTAIGIAKSELFFKMDENLATVYKAKGSKTFAQLPTSFDNSIPAYATQSLCGNVYNVTDDFTTTELFIEGAGKSYPAGTNVVVVYEGGAYKLDVL